MKTMKMILAGVLLMLPLLCQAQKNLFNKYGDMKGVSSVYISKAMIETNPNLFTKDVLYWESVRTVELCAGTFYNG